MAITYDVVYKNNRRIPLSGPCFGAFSDSGYPSSSIRHGYANQRGLTSEELRGLHADFQNTSFFQFYPTPSEYWKDPEDTSVKDREVRFYNEMKALVADIPWMKASIHPLLGVIRVTVVGKPADQVMMTLFLMRNLAHYEYAIGYRYLRSVGFKPFAAAIFSSLWKRGEGTVLRPNSNWAYTTVGEYNWVSPATFGTQSLHQLVNSDETFNPWVQELWSQVGHYRRDRWFQTNSVRFTTPGGGMSYRKLIDCLSVENDTPIFPRVSGNGTWRMDHVIPHENFQPIIDEFITKCREAGYSPIMSE